MPAQCSRSSSTASRTWPTSTSIKPRRRWAGASDCSIASVYLDRLPTPADPHSHGDYHLGQVLAVEDDFVILDFEGEPARPLSERRTKQLAVKDVAGMLRSLSYAAFASLFAKAGDSGPEYDRLEPWAGFWERCTSAAFLHAYREDSAGAPFVPADDEEFPTLLNAFLLDKALYELKYELNNRPGMGEHSRSGVSEPGAVGWRSSRQNTGKRLSRSAAASTRTG
jgi:hypothetical protein